MAVKKVWHTLELLFKWSRIEKRKMSEYIKISNDQLQDWAYRGPSCETNGQVRHGIYLQHFKNGMVKKSFINNGHVMISYKYPLINAHFHSPYINDFNLHLCGGWSWRGINDVNKTIFERVVSGLKPMGGLYGTTPQCVEKLEQYQKEAEAQGFVTHRYTTHVECLNIATSAYFQEVFNFKDLQHDYDLYYWNEDKTEINKIFDKLEKQRVSNYVKEWDYANPTTEEETIIVGLILGYPIETTASLLWYR